MRCPCSTGLPYAECCEPVHDGARLAPTAEETAWARRVVVAAAALPPEHAGAFRVDGRMVDRPVLRRARQLVAQVEGGRS